LLVKEAVVGEGPTFKRFRARARGSASPLRKRTSHIRIVLADELASTAPASRARKAQPAGEAATVVADDQAKSEPTPTPRKSSGRKTASRTPKGSAEGTTTKRQSPAQKEEKE
jgi:large subunit ribosomal protein L22